MSHKTAVPVTAPMPAFKSWLCVLCGFVYHEQDGLPEDGIAPGTRWEDVSDDWVCAECGTGKSDFEMTEI